MAELMDAFLAEPTEEQVVVGWQAIGFGPEAMRRNHGCAAAELGLTKDKGQDRDEKVDTCHPENAMHIARSILEESSE